MALCRPLSCLRRRPVADCCSAPPSFAPFLPSPASPPSATTRRPQLASHLCCRRPRPLEHARRRPPRPTGSCRPFVAPSSSPVMQPWPQAPAPLHGRLATSPSPAPPRAPEFHGTSSLQELRLPCSTPRAMVATPSFCCSSHAPLPLLPPIVDVSFWASWKTHLR